MTDEYEIKELPDSRYTKILKSLSSTTKPSFILYNENDMKIYEDWAINGMLSRTDGPARISYFADGHDRTNIGNPTGIQSKEYYLDNMRHRPDGPAAIYYGPESGKIIKQVYYEYDRLHRVDGPALIDHTRDSDVDEAWYYKNVLHRIGGPAVKGRNGTSTYYIHGIEATKEQIDNFEFADINNITEEELMLFKLSI